MLGKVLRMKIAVRLVRLAWFDTTRLAFSNPSFGLTVPAVEFEGRSINIKLYDVYNSVAVGLIISSLGAIVMYNVLCRKSFEAAGKDWMDLVLRMKGVKKFPVVIIATHCDQGTEEDWQVPHSDGAALADQIGCPFLETSAKDNINIDETITDVLAEIMGSQALEGAGRAKRKRGGCVVC